jgi:hypothetical protein
MIGVRAKYEVELYHICLQCFRCPAFDCVKLDIEKFQDPLVGLAKEQTGLRTWHIEPPEREENPILSFNPSSYGMRDLRLITD